MYGETLQCHNWSVLHSNEALLIFLADREALRIEQCRRPMRCSNRKLLIVFEGSAQRERTIVEGGVPWKPSTVL